MKDADGNELDPSNYDVTVTKGGKEVDSATDAGDYEVKVTGKTFDFDLGGNDTFYLTVAPLSVDRIEVVGDLDANGYSYLAWTGEELKPSYKFFDYVDGDYVEVEVPAEAYDVTYTMTYERDRGQVRQQEGRPSSRTPATYIATFEDGGQRQELRRQRRGHRARHQDGRLPRRADERGGTARASTTLPSSAT